MAPDTGLRKAMEQLFLEKEARVIAAFTVRPCVIIQQYDMLATLKGPSLEMCKTHGQLLYTCRMGSVQAAVCKV
jgi:hypothetical protein